MQAGARFLSWLWAPASQSLHHGACKDGGNEYNENSNDSEYKVVSRRLAVCS